MDCFRLTGVSRAFPLPVLRERVRVRALRQTGGYAGVSDRTLNPGRALPEKATRSVTCRAGGGVFGQAANLTNATPCHYCDP